MKNDDWLLPKPAPTSIFRALPEGGVLFSTSSEVYFGVNLVGARIWELLPPVHRTFNQLCDSLSAQFSDVSDDIIRGDAGRFLEHLLSNGLVIETKPEDHSPDGSGP